MFRFRRPEAAHIEEQIRSSATLLSDHPGVLSLASGLCAPVPPGLVRDSSRIVLGRGDRFFDSAREAMRNWAEFDLGWVQIADRRAPIADGQVVAVTAHTAGLWSVNLSRIVETIDTPRQFGFLYATTPMHVEYGEERFLIERDEASDQVSYTIEAVSRPRSALARLGYPFTRAMQRKFARESLARMKSAVNRN